jgi:hypothetical protein
MNRFWRLAVMVLAGWTVTPGRAPAGTDRSPSIQVDDFFDSLVDALRDASPTFSRQYERIADFPLARVSIRMLPKGEESCCRARTTIRRYPSGALIAWVEIPSPRTRLEYAELLGHEFEHILEQIDRVDLDAQADEGAGAARVGNGAYETARARRAGEAVALETAVKGPASEALRPR